MTTSMVTRLAAPLLTAAMLVAPLAQQAAAGGLPVQLSAPHSATDAKPVQWRRGGGGLRWFGPGPGLAVLGGVIIGGALVASAIAERRASDSDIRRCSRDFPEFDPRSGTWVDRHGEVRVCPYLR